MRRAALSPAPSGTGAHAARPDGRRAAGRSAARRRLDELGGISERTFYRWREIGKFPTGIRLPNGKIRVYRSEFEAWLESLREAA
ncbi:helix-turn-helix domain-containing protein [Streptosporangium canum]|uniref:helix-turn-helix transcriptional regulator n=1 Tax=Streptosporangium canum TaxID=324952 RepID=UPI003430B0AE